MRSELSRHRFEEVDLFQHLGCLVLDQFSDDTTVNWICSPLALPQEDLVFGPVKCNDIYLNCSTPVRTDFIDLEGQVAFLTLHSDPLTTKFFKSG